jgi:hypothetical protein
MPVKLRSIGLERLHWNDSLNARRGNRQKEPPEERKDLRDCGQAPKSRVPARRLVTLVGGPPSYKLESSMDPIDSLQELQTYGKQFNCMRKGEA